MYVLSTKPKYKRTISRERDFALLQQPDVLAPSFTLPNVVQKATSKGFENHLKLF